MARITSATTSLCRKNLCTCADEQEIIPLKKTKKE